MDLNCYLSEAVDFGICFLMNISLYQVCLPLKTKKRAGTGQTVTVKYIGYEIVKGRAGQGFVVSGFSRWVWH